MSTYRKKGTDDLHEAQQWVPNVVIDGVTRYTSQDGKVLDKAYLWMDMERRNVDIHPTDWVVWDKDNFQFVMSDENFRREFEEP